MTFASLKERFDYLLDNNYLETQFIQKYDFAFIEKLYAQLEAADFRTTSGPPSIQKAWSCWLITLVNDLIS